MTTLINSFQVKNFGEWQEVFNSGEAMRSAAGVSVKGIYRSVEDDKHVTVISEIAGGVEQVKAMMGNFKDVMEKSGVISESIDIKIVSSVN